MTARFDRAWAKASRANLAAAIGFLLTMSASSSASAARATQEQRSVRRLDRNIHAVRAMANCPLRQKASPSEV